jgi:hypothetical protein
MFIVRPDGFPKRRRVEGASAEKLGCHYLSRVGFDLGGRHAVVYAQLTYCGLCGEGTYLYLLKETGAWHIVGRAGTWIS